MAEMYCKNPVHDKHHLELQHLHGIKAEGSHLRCQSRGQCIFKRPISLALAQLFASALLGCSSPAIHQDSSTIAQVILASTNAGAPHSREARLTRRHRTPVIELSSFAVALPEAQHTYSLYAFDSFDAWRRYRQLEPWEREDVEWSAEGEHDLWVAGLAQEGLLEEAQGAADAEFARCADPELRERLARERGPDNPCAEQIVWADVLRRLGAHGCPDDRLGIAAFHSGRRDELIAAFLFEGRRCHAEASRLAVVELGGTPGPEVLVEVSWRTVDGGQNLELYIFSTELRLQLRRRLLTGVTDGREASEEDAHYWFDDLDDDTQLELVIERLHIEGGTSCISPEERLRLQTSHDTQGESTDADASADDRCERQVLERVVLRYADEGERWLEGAPMSTP